MTNVDAKLIGESVDIHGEGNHPQGCAFSPDGLCVLTATVGDGKLRLYNTLHANKKSQHDCNVSTINNGDDANGETPTPLLPDTEQWKTALVCRAGDAVRSYAWYPHMKSSDPSSCCFIAASRDQPIHLFDAYAGTVRASYRPYNHLDEMESPVVTTFSPDGQRIWAAGFRTDRTIHVFDTARPGRDATTVLRLGKTRRSSDGQKGLVSSIALSSGSSRIFCVGTYSPGSIYLYDDRTGEQPTGTILNGLCVVGHGRSHSRRKRRFAAANLQSGEDKEEDSFDDVGAAGDDDKGLDWLSSAKFKWFLNRAQGGITQMRFMPDYTLFSASRRSNAILLWDLRMLSGNSEYQSQPIRGVASYATKNDTNQRLEFDVLGQTLFVGGLDKCVRIYDTKSYQLIGSIKDLDDATNGISCTRLGQMGMLAVATGARRFPDLLDDDKDDEDTLTVAQSPGLLRLYKVSDLDQ